MAVVPMKCKVCNGALVLDELNDVWICPYCNTKTVLTKDVYNVTVGIGDSQHITGLLTMMTGSFEQGDMEQAKEYADKLLAIDEAQSDCWIMKSRIYLVYASNYFSELLDECGSDDLRTFSLGDLCIKIRRNLQSSFDNLKKYNVLTNGFLKLTDLLDGLGDRVCFNLPEKLFGGGTVRIRTILRSADFIVFEDPISQFSMAVEHDRVHAVYGSTEFNLRNGGFVEKGHFDDAGYLIEGEILRKDSYQNGFFVRDGIAEGSVTLYGDDGDAIICAEGKFNPSADGTSFESGNITFYKAGEEVDFILSCDKWEYSQIKGQTLSSKSRYREILGVTLKRNGQEVRGSICHFITAKGILVEYRLGLLTRFSQAPYHFIESTSKVLGIGVDLELELSHLPGVISTTSEISFLKFFNKPVQSRGLED